MTVEITARYAAYYCEENVWHLCQEARFEGIERSVVFISNPARSCPMWCQRSAQAPGEPVVWDYHVVLLALLGGAWRVFDLDSTLGPDVDFAHYLSRAIIPHGPLPSPWTRWFRVVPHASFLAEFSSDRSHMCEGTTWLAPPPPWPLIQARPGGHNLFDFVDVQAEFVGEILGLDGLNARFGV